MDHWQGGAGLVVISGGNSIFWIVFANCRKQETKNSQHHNRIDILEDNQESAKENDVPLQTKQDQTGTTAPKASISWPPEESLPAVKTQIDLASNITLEVNEESILVRGEPVLMQFGIITNSQKATRLMASLLQKHQNLIDPLFKDKDSQGPLNLLATEVQKEWPEDAIASWCFINGNEKIYHTQVFGAAKLKINLQPDFGAFGICEHDNTAKRIPCRHEKPNFKFQCILLKVFPIKEYELKNSFLTTEDRFVDGAYHDSLPDHHWISLYTTWNDINLRFPHPDHYKKDPAHI